MCPPKGSNSTLKNEIISTADYIVKKEFDGTEILLTPKINQQAIQIEKLPYQIGYSKYESKNYPVSNLYNLNLDEEYIQEKSLNNELEISKIKSKIFENLPQVNNRPLSYSFICLTEHKIMAIITPIIYSIYLSSLINYTISL